MLNVSFFEQKVRPQIKVEFCNNLSRIPFEISIGSFDSFPRPIYARNLSDNSFIEFRFNKDNGDLFEITMVSVKVDSVIKDVPFLDLECESTFTCNLNSANSVLEDKMPTKIYSGDNLFCLMIGDPNETKLKYYKIAADIFLGVDENSFLRSLVLKNLSKENLNNILGF